MPRRRRRRSPTSTAGDRQNIRSQNSIAAFGGLLTEALATFARWSGRRS